MNNNITKDTNFLNSIFENYQLFLSDKIKYDEFVELTMPKTQGLQRITNDSDYMEYVRHWICLDSDIADMRSGKVFTSKDWEDTESFIQNKFLPLIELLIKKYE